MNNKVVKSVSFNITNEKDKEMLDRLENVNFSGYVKELIAADIQRRTRPMGIVKKTKKGGIKIVLG